jgi:3-oxoadipate enol-lactonase
MIHERTIAASGRTIRYLESGNGWPVILLHGFPLTADMWRPQLERAPDGWRLLAPDLKGFGPRGGQAAQTLDEMARDVAAWLDALEIDRAAIGGLSMGGYLTFALFRRVPERFTAMILANTRAAADSLEGRAARDQMSALVRSQGPSAVADQMLPKLLGGSSRENRPDLAALVRGMIERQTVDAIDGAVQAMKQRPDSTPLLARVAIPVLVIASEEDSIIPVSESIAMSQQLARAQQVTIPRAGHMSNLEAPEDFSEALENFLRAHI